MHEHNFGMQLGIKYVGMGRVAEKFLKIAGLGQLWGQNTWVRVGSENISYRNLVQASNRN